MGGCCSAEGDDEQGNAMQSALLPAQELSSSNAHGDYEQLGDGGGRASSAANPIDKTKSLREQKVHVTSQQAELHGECPAHAPSRASQPHAISPARRHAF